MSWLNSGRDIPPDAGEIVDAEIVDDSQPSRLRSVAEQKKDREPKSGIPDIDEWMGFISRVLIRGATDFYVWMAFQGIDEDDLSEREIDRIVLRSEERDRIARPFAELASKMKWTRKHGRMIVASGDSIDSILTLGMWFTRVTRIAAKHRAIASGQIPYRQSRPPRPPRQPRRPRHSPRRYPAGNQQHEEEVNVNGSNRQGDAPPPNGHEPGWRPSVAGPVWNPDGG